MKNKWKQTNNTPSLDNAIILFHEKYDNAPDTMILKTKSLRSNAGLALIERVLKGENIDKEELIISFRDMVLPEDVRTVSSRFIELAKSSLEKKTKAPLLIINGDKGTGKKTLAKAISNELGLKYRLANSGDLFPSQEEEKREPEIVLFNDPKEGMRFYRNCPNHLFPVIVFDNIKPQMTIFGEVRPISFHLISENHIEIKLDQSLFEEDKIANELIRSILTRKHFASDVGLVSKRHFSKAGIGIVPSHITSLVERASERSICLGSPFSIEHLDEVLLEIKKATRTMNGDVDVIYPKKSLKDLVVSDDVREQIEEIIFRAKSLESCRYEFVRKLRNKPRLSCLFPGPPGTGKSMTAEVIGYELNKEVWVCDLGRIQSAYVGETEKKLGELFKMAESNGVVLLIDECDSLFGDRSASTSSYEKRNINHILNLIENYGGIIVCTTNYSVLLDKAFERRFDKVVEFKNPNIEQMKSLLKTMLEPDAPLSPDFDYDLALRGVRLSGGLIRNAIESLASKLEMSGEDVITSEMINDCLLSVQGVSESKRNAIGLR